MKIIGLAVEVFFESRAPDLLQIRIGIFSIREQNDLDVQVLFQYQVESAQGCFDPGRIAVVEDLDVGGVTFDQVDLSDGQRGARGSYHVFYPGLVQGNGHRYSLLPGCIHRSAGCSSGPGERRRVFYSCCRSPFPVS